MIPNALKFSIKDHLTRNPSDANELLICVAESLQAYEKAQTTKRNGLADFAIRTLMDPKQFAKLTIPYIIDAVFHQFPRGPLCHSQNERSCWDIFVGKCETEPIDMKWLEQVKGEEMFDWYMEIVKPHVVE